MHHTSGGDAIQTEMANSVAVTRICDMKEHGSVVPS